MKVTLAKKGGSDYQKGLQFIRDKVLALDKNKKRRIQCYFTCATDTDLMKKVIDSVNNSILMKQAEQINTFY